MVTSVEEATFLLFSSSFSSSMHLPEVELSRQMRGLQFGASVGDNSSPPSYSIAGLIIKHFSSCLHHSSSRCALLFLYMFYKVQQKSHELLSREKLLFGFFFNLNLVIRKTAFDLPVGW